jgi:hypothetical protein
MGDSETGKEQERAPGGRFRAGVSGNPAGRPRGSRNKITQLCGDLLGDKAEEIMQRVVKDALKGRAVALRLVVDRLVPIKGARDRMSALELPAVHAAGELVDASAAVISATASGEISLGEAKEYMQLLETQRRILETGELARRLEHLEATVPGASPVRTEIERVRLVLDEHLNVERKQ